MEYILKYNRTVKKDIRTIPKSVLIRIERIILALRINPYPPNTKRLKNYPDYYRIRFSSYRIIYTIDNNDNYVTILKIGHRKDIYDKISS